MKHPFVPAALIFLLLLAGTSLSAQTSTVFIEQSQVPRRFLLQFGSSQGAAAASVAGGKMRSPFAPSLLQSRRGILAAQAESSKQLLERLRSWRVLECPAGQNADSLLALITALHQPTLIVPVHRYHIENQVTNDPLVAEQWALKTMNAQKAWKTATGKGVVIGYVDTGIEWEHPDLQSQTWINTGEDLNANGIFDAWLSTEKRNGISGDIDGIDNDGNGYTDDVIGYNFVDQYVGNLGNAYIRDGQPFDDQGHGTSVAGVLCAAANNQKGIAGLAYDAKVMVLKAFDITGNAEDDDVAAAIVYAAVNGAKVLNFSFGDIVKSPIVEDAVRFAASLNVIMVASSGNSGGDGNHYPSDYPEIIAVGASNEQDKRSIFSSYNSRLSLIAPGEGIQTTAVGKSYRSVNGTSFSSPYVAATAALLLEKNPALSPAQIRSILETTASPISGENWSHVIGSGRVHAADALELASGGRAEITSPRLDVAINCDKQKTLSIQGVITEPFLKSWSLKYAFSDAPKSWTTMSSADTAVVREQKIGSLDISTLRDTTIILSLVLEWQNGRTVERRTRFRTIGSAPLFTKATAVNAWYNGRKVVVISTRCNQPCTLVAEYQDLSNTQRTVSDAQKFGMNHTLVLDDDAAPAHGNVPLRLIAVSAEGDTATKELQVEAVVDYVRREGFALKSFKAPRLYVDNINTNYRQDNTTFIASDLRNEARRIGVYRLSGDSVVAAEVGPPNYFARGIGDADGDGKDDIFAQSGGKSVLFTGSTSAFGALSFADTLNQNFWASRVADVNGDGRAELLGYRTGRIVNENGVKLPASDDFEVWTYEKGKFRILDSITNPTQPSFDKVINNCSSPGCAVGDFDKDAKIEVAFTDSDGDLVVNEWKGSGFGVEFVAETDENAAGGTEFTTEVDIDGDGTPEILSGYPISPSYNADGEYDTPLWVFHLYRATSANSYSEIWKDYFYGVRYGRPYYNGVAASDVDGRKGDEIILSLYPNLYVFTSSANSQQLAPMWYSDGVWSNSALITDLDGNGRKEIAFASERSLSTEFWEYANIKPEKLPPTGVVAVYDDATSTIKVRWLKQALAGAYELTMDNTRFRTTDTAMTLENVPTDAQIRIQLMSLADTADRSLNPRSEPVYVITAALAQITTISAASVGQRQLMVGFSDRVQQQLIEPRSFYWFTLGGEKHYTQSVIHKNDTTLLLIFSQPFSEVGKFTLACKALRDYYNRPMNTNSKIFEITEAAPQPESLVFTRIVALDSLSITAEFSEAVEETSALNPANYQLLPTGGIQTIRITDAAKRIVQFQLDASHSIGARGIRYELVALPSVKAQSGNSMSSGSGNSLSFVFNPTNTDGLYVYPQPARLHEGSMIVFAGVPQGATVNIMNLEGNTIAQIKETNANGGVEWDGRSYEGIKVSSGVYLYRVIQRDGSESELHKFTLLP